jgi:hypothetical protein
MEIFNPYGGKLRTTGEPHPSPTWSSSAGDDA